MDPWTFLIPAGSPVVEANGSTWSSPYPVVAMFWPRRFYQVFLLLKSDTTEYYCNVIRPPVYHPNGHQVIFHDLELDVYVSDDGVEVRDTEEFALSKEAYPDELIAGALAGADELVVLGSERRGPFSGTVNQFWRQFVETRLPFHDETE